MYVDKKKKKKKKPGKLDYKQYKELVLLFGLIVGSIVKP